MTTKDVSTQKKPTPKFYLRAVEPEDIDFLYRIENMPQIWSVSWGDAPVSRQLLWQYINSYTSDIYADRQLRFIIDIDGVPAGTIDITDFDPRNSRAMIGVAVAPDFQGQGVAKEAIKRTIAMCRDTFGMHQLAAMVPRDNEVSLHIFETLGFSTSGCLRSWLRRGKSYVDVVVMQILL